MKHAIKKNIIHKTIIKNVYGIESIYNMALINQSYIRGYCYWELKYFLFIILIWGPCLQRSKLPFLQLYTCLSPFPTLLPPPILCPSIEFKEIPITIHLSSSYLKVIEFRGTRFIILLFYFIFVHVSS